MPFTPDDKTQLSSFGRLADITRFDAFLEKTTALKLRMGTFGTTQANLSYHVFGGVSVLFPEERFFCDYYHVTRHSPVAGFDEKSAVIDYGAYLGLETEHFDGSMGLIGMMLTEDGIEGFDERSLHQGEFSGGVRLGRCHADVSFLVPLDDDLLYAALLRYSFGFQLTIDLSSSED